MSNPDGGQKAPKEKPVRKSKIRKSIERIWNIAPYESLKISVAFEEDVEWADLAQRNKKSANWTKLLIDDFNQTAQDVFRDQDVSEHKVFHKDSSAQNNTDAIDELDALEDYLTYTGDSQVNNAIEKGATFYKDYLFLEDGTPKFSPGSIYPIDGHCLAQGILTFTRLSHRNAEYLSFAEKIAEWGKRNFQHPDGYFYFQRRKFWTNRTSHIRWVQAWMFLALNRLLFAMKNPS